MTRGHVVELILDLAGYTADRPLHELPLLEPSCGHGAFVAEAAKRLVASARAREIDLESLSSAIVAIEVDTETTARAMTLVRKTLIDEDVPSAIADKLVDAWITSADFLLHPLEARFAFAVGNPPYVRIEQIHRELQNEYRDRYPTLYDRADLYVAFIERSLRLLVPEGRLSFICADRWTNNKYGKVLRNLIASEFWTDAFVKLEGGSPFEEDVTAYPSIFTIRRGRGDHTRVYTIAGDDWKGAEAVAGDFREEGPTSSLATIYRKWFIGDEPWTLTGEDHLATLRQLEDKFPVLESAATKVSIGIASIAASRSRSRWRFSTMVPLSRSLSS